MDRKLFVDTMVFLHFRPLSELDLATRVRSDKVTLVLPRITLRELDKHKSVHSNRKVRDRARRVLMELENAIANGSSLNGDIAVEYFPIHPKEELERLNLNSEWADDILVASVIAYRDRTSNTNITVVSQDTGPRLTCRHHEIETLQLDDSVALSENLDDTERENRALQQQVQRLQSTMPRLEAVFKGAETPPNVARFTLHAHTLIDDQELADSIERLREAYPKKAVMGEFSMTHPLARSINNTTDMMDQFDLNAINPDQIRRYNSELDDFYANAESYFRTLHDFSEPSSRTISFVLEISNTGTAPADDVDVLFHFPDGFRLLTEDELPEVPEPPDPPEEPLGRIDQLSRPTNSTYSMLAKLASLTDVSPLSSLRIQKTQSYIVTDHFARIKHGIPATLSKLYIEFPSLTEARSFRCTYELRPANLAAPVTGDLHFVIEREEN